MPRKVRCNSILERIGNTPLIRINKITKELQKRNVEIYVKAEWFNPGGSVKDRPALRIVEDAEKSGKLGGDKILIDSTSGNTGIAYAFIGAVKGYEVNLVMPLNVSEERKRIVSAFGTKTIYTDPLLGSDGAMNEARDWSTKPLQNIFMAISTITLQIGCRTMKQPVLKYGSRQRVT